MQPDSVIYSIATKIGSSGLGTVSYNAIKALQEKNLLKLAVAYADRSDIPKSKIVTLHGNPAKLLFFLPRRYYRPLRKVFFDYVTSKFILRKGCEVFHGWNGQALRSMKAARKIGAKTIIESGSTHRFHKDAIISDEYNRIGISVNRGTETYKQAALEELSLADFIFVPSDFAKKTFMDAGFSSDKLFVIERGADLNRFRPGNPDQHTFKALFVGRVSLRKGIRYLLEAWESLKLTNAELILAGAIDETIRPVISKYSNNRSIIFSGFLKDPASVYRDAHIFVFPSLEEGSAKVTFEAMASGLPVVTTDSSGSVVRDSLDGFIVPAGDISSLKDKIAFLYENREAVEIMGRNARERVKPYTWERYRQTLLKTYENIFA
jgi:glycosyltransferase involved in cell wall biosynthesis